MQTKPREDVCLSGSLELLLRPQLIRMATLLFAAVGGAGRQASVTFPADHLVAVVLAGQGLEGGLDDASAQPEDEVQGGFLKFPTLWNHALEKL